MARFESGVKRYITGEAIVRNGFPVNYSDKADISCMHCKYFGRNSGVCYLTKEVTAYPEKYVGNNCPFELTEE